ncbi:hypothetical protein PRIC1_005021 [Phytophthora ramorum]
MKFSNKDASYLLFIGSELSPGMWKYNSCKKDYEEGCGYTNQMHHLLKMHPDYQQMEEASFCKRNRLGRSLPGQPTRDVFHWSEWCVLERMLVSFCERPFVPKNSMMEAIAAATLTEYINLLYGYVRDVISAKLPDRFGIVLDG